MKKLRIGSLFSGIGGLDLAVEAFFRARTAWHCEFDAEPSKVLAARWPGVPNFGDVTAVDWASVEPVDILCGGFPCQDVSLAGRRAGMVDGTRSGLWSHFRLAISVVKPKVVIVENVRGLLSADGEAWHDDLVAAAEEVDRLSKLLAMTEDFATGNPAHRREGRAAYARRWRFAAVRVARHRKWAMARFEHERRLVQRAIAIVLRDLADLGFDAEWHGLLASDIGAPHARFRVFILAHARGVRFDERWDSNPSEAQGGWPSALVGGRADAPLTLFPTPAAMNPNDGEGTETWLARRERVKLSAKNGNGMGMPPAIAVQLLPTPTTTDGGSNSPADRLRRSPGLRTVPSLLPTPTARDEASSGGSSASNVTLTDAVVRTDFGRQANPRLLPTPTTEPDTGNGHARNLGAEVKPSRWGEYEAAVCRWEAVTRPAPSPTLPDGKNGNHRLAAVFPEWMMGYPGGWVTDILARKPAIKACGNGVLPQQAFAALSILWPRVRSARNA